MNNSSVSHLRKPLALLSAGLSLFAANAALAQTPASDEAVKLEKFVVTGSLIPMAANTPAVPITIVSAVDIENTGVSNDLTDVLKKANPSFFGRGNIGQENANTRANGTNGASTVSLRNRATLVLINGRRASISPVAATGGGAFVDVSLIPVSAVERVEILSDGASATYGSDAVSGVVNFILKSDYRGAEIGGSYGWAPNAGNYAQRRAYMTVGAGNDKTQVTVSAEWRSTDPLYQFERPWGLNQFRTPTFAGVVTTDGGVTRYYLNPTLNAPPLNTDMTLAQLVAAGIYTGPYDQAQVAQFFDLSAKSTMFQATQRRSLFLNAEHKWSDSITAFSDILVTNSITFSSLNAQPVSGSVAASAAVNPFDVTVTAANRFVNFPRLRIGDTLGVRGVFGLRGDIGDSTWKWELAATLNRSTQYLRQQNLIDTLGYNAAVLNGTYNPFARVQNPGVIEGFVGTGYQDYVSRVNGFDLRVNGEIMQLPAGALQAGFGLETRKEAVSMVNDRNDRLALWLQGTPTNPFSAESTVDAFSAEIRVPVFSKDQGIRFANTLELTLAGRKEIYTSTTDPLVPKFSLRWLPFNDEFAVRATYGESFTAPTLFSLYGPSNSGFTASININRYTSAGTLIGPTGARQYRSRGGSNPNLIPSESRNWTAGVVWSPRAIKGLSVSLDWFDIDERNLVGNIPITTLLQSVEQLGAASPYAGQVRVATSVAGENHFTDGAPITAPGQVTAGQSDAVWVTNPLLNISGAWQSGAELRIDYMRDTASMGKFDFGTVLSYINDYWTQNLPTSAPFDFGGTFSGTSTYPRWRTYSSVDWTYKAFAAGIGHTFIPTLDDVAAPVLTEIDSYHTVDLRLGYKFSGHSNRWLSGMSLTVGVNNVLNEDPPFATSEADQNRDINTYDALGRYFYVSANYKF
jgi:iron complex outermembrane receptor protein